MTEEAMDDYDEEECMEGEDCDEPADEEEGGTGDAIDEDDECAEGEDCDEPADKNGLNNAG